MTLWQGNLGCHISGDHFISKQVLEIRTYAAQFAHDAQFKVLYQDRGTVAISIPICVSFYILLQIFLKPGDVTGCDFC